MEQTQKEPRLCDLVRSRLNNKNYLLNRDNAFREFGLYTSGLLDIINNADEESFLPELEFLSSFRNAILKEFDMSYEDLDKYIVNGLNSSSFFQRWVDGKLVEDTEHVVWDDLIDEKFITEDDIIFAIYHTSCDELKEEFKNSMLEHGLDKSILDKFLNKEDLDFDSLYKLVSIFEKVFSPNYKAIVKNLFPNVPYIFVPLKDFDINF